MALRTSDITTADIWQVVMEQWARDEGAAALQESDQAANNEDISDRDDPMMTLSSDDDDEWLRDNRLSTLYIGTPHPPETIYLEKLMSPNGMMLTAFKKNLSALSCANMVSVDEKLRKKNAYLFHVEEDFLSLLVCWDCRFIRGLLGDELEGWVPCALKAENKSISRPVSGKIVPPAVDSTTLRLALSHPAIRKSVTSLELGIYPPHAKDSMFVSGECLGDRVSLAEKREELKAALALLAQDLASFENLLFVKIVLMGWGRGSQTFKKDGVGADCVLPFCDLLESGVFLGIQVQLWGSIRVEDRDLTVQDDRREMNRLEALDFEEQFDARRFELGKDDMDLTKTVEHKTTIIQRAVYPKRRSEMLTDMW